MGVSMLGTRPLRAGLAVLTDSLYMLKISVESSNYFKTNFTKFLSELLSAGQNVA